MTYAPATRHFGTKQPTKAALRQALASILIMRADLSSIDPASLCRSYGVKPDELESLVVAEHERRASGAAA